MEESAAPCKTYTRRRPENTVCYQIVSQHLETFLEEQRQDGMDLPKYIHNEFNAYLQCGILANGFLRLRCENCKSESVVAFSCKKRGFCPSCCGKRMNEAAAHLTENILPHVPYRQFVVTLPIPMRHWVAKNKKLMSTIQRIVIDVIQQHYKNGAAALKIDSPAPGTITFLQRWGSALNLHPHLHILCTDGVFYRHQEQPLFYNMTRLSDKDVEIILKTITQRMIRYCRRLGYLNRNGEVIHLPDTDDLFNDHPNLSQIVSASIAGKVAFGPNAGRSVTAIGKGFGYQEEIPLAKGKLCFSLNGFSMHARTKTNTLDRDGLERLMRYMARGPLGSERLEIVGQNKVQLRLKTPWEDGTHSLTFSFSEFLERLTALIPLPRAALVRWGGCFAPASPYRKEIVLKPQLKKGFDRESEDATPQVRFNRSKLLARTFKIDVDICEHCGGNIKIIAGIVNSFEISRYLKNIGETTDSPARAPPKYTQGEFDLKDLKSPEDIAVYID